MLLKHLLIALFALFFVVLAGCSAHSGEDMLGKWEDKRNAEHTLVVERNGDNFLIRRTQSDFLEGGLKTVSIPATLKDGLLTTDQFFSLTLDKKSGLLTDGRNEYQRAK